MISLIVVIVITMVHEISNALFKTTKIMLNMARFSFQFIILAQFDNTESKIISVDHSLKFH